MSKATQAAPAGAAAAAAKADEKPMQCPYKCPYPLTGPPVVWEGVEYKTFSIQDHLAFRALADTVPSDAELADKTRVNPWKLRLAENGVYTWDKKQDGEPMKLIKVFGVIPDVEPAMLYDVLHDAEYRKVWDERRLDGYRFCMLDAACEIGYYAGKLGFALSDREFVNQRGWINVGNGEYIIWNTSVPIKRMEKEHKDRIRAISKVSGYLIRPWGKGSSITYVTQTDPRGMIPSSLINFVTSKFAPTTIVTFGNACKKYPEWVKTQGDKYSKPWMVQADGTTNPTPFPTPQRNVIYEWIAARAKTPADHPPPMPPPMAVSPASPSSPTPGRAGPVDNYWVQPADGTPLNASPASPAGAAGATPGAPPAAAAAAAAASGEEDNKKEEEEKQKQGADKK